METTTVMTMTMTTMTMTMTMTMMTTMMTRWRTMRILARLSGWCRWRRETRRQLQRRI
jgi:hypothetical protein